MGWTIQIACQPSKLHTRLMGAHDSRKSRKDYTRWNNHGEKSWWISVCVQSQLVQHTHMIQIWWSAQSNWCCQAVFTLSNARKRELCWYVEVSQSWQSSFTCRWFKGTDQYVKSVAWDNLLMHIITKKKRRSLVSDYFLNPPCQFTRLHSLMSTHFSQSNTVLMDKIKSHHTFLPVKYPASLENMSSPKQNESPTAFHFNFNTKG